MSTPPKMQSRPGAVPGDGRMSLFALLAGILALVIALMSLGIALSRSNGARTDIVTAVANDTSTTASLIDASAKPAADWKPFDATLHPVEGGTTHNATFHMSHTMLEVAPGVTQMMWTFNGQVPGPTLHGHIGDIFNVMIINDVDMPHSIDFHASQTSMDVDMRSIGRGESLVYQFRAVKAGIYMYHCGTAPALLHIGSGMYGAVVVDPPSMPAVAHEYVIVQSELYLGAKGGEPDFNKMKADAPDAVVFNGYYNQYKYSPLMVKAGDRIRIWVIDDGPSDSSSFHVVGTIFDTVYKEGNYLLPRGSSGGSQAVDLGPAQGGFVEFTVTKPGMYAMVTHKFADANNGAVGIIHAI